HPLVGEVRATLSKSEFVSKYGLDSSRRIVTILPGSRAGEIARHLPTLLESARLLAQKEPSAFNFALALSVETDPTFVRGLVAEAEKVTVIEGDTYNALASADAAIICSGTATVESALLDVPMVVVYKVSRLTGLLAKPLIRTKFFGMVNLIADREVAPEFIQ